MIPVIALVGRPNVGKSTLFNRLIKTRKALVADIPGLTRDRQYGQGIYLDKSFIIVDTGGIGVDDLAVDALMSQQSEIALDEADMVFFMVDARDGCTGVDEEILDFLRKKEKPVYLLVNKSEGLDETIAVTDFLQLGLNKLYPISAAHGQGINELLSDVLKNYTESKSVPEFENSIKVAFIGRPNVGKSTLINRILGEERVVVYDMPGTTRDSIAVPFAREDQNYVLIDTAGVRRRARIGEKIEKFSVIKTMQSIKESHVCVMLLDAKQGISDQDLHLLSVIIESGRALVIAINKWDGLDEDHKDQIKNDIERKLYFCNFAKKRFISALHGTGVGLIFKDIKQAYESANESFSTSKLTRLLEDFISQHPPPMIKGRRIKLRYAHPGGHNPPIIVIHGNQLLAIPDSYKRYLNKSFIKHLGLVGTPLKLEFKQSENPYKDKKNKLTPRQARKRKRMFKKIKK